MCAWYNDFDHPLVKEFFLNERVSYPSSTGMDGVVVHHNDGSESFIQGDAIVKSVQYACSVRTGFIRGDILYTLPDWYIEEIRRYEFKQRIACELSKINQILNR